MIDEPADANALVAAAGSLVRALDTDTLGIVTRRVEEDLICGRWDLKERTEHLNGDEHLEVTKTGVQLWLRADGGALFVQTTEWVTYNGKTKDAPEFGAGGSTEIIGLAKDNGSHCQRAPPEVTDAFITNPTAEMKGYGKWWVSTDTDQKDGDALVKTLHVKGDGYFCAGAFEDDDLLYSGAGPRKGITFAVDESELRARYTRTLF